MIVGWLVMLINNAPGPMLPPEWRPAYVQARADPKAFCATFNAIAAKRLEREQVKLPGPVDADVIAWNMQELTCPRDGSAPSWRMNARASR